METVFGKRRSGHDVQIQKPLRCRIVGIMEGMTTLHVAEVLDLSLRGALIEHQGMFHPECPCFLQLGIEGNVSTIRCRIAHSRASSTGSDGHQYYKSILEFRNITPAAEHIIKTLIQSLWAHAGWHGVGP